jgi:hypothetical protein
MSNGADAAAEGLRLLLAGDLDAGLGLYRNALRGDALPSVPVGLHLLFLEKAGRAEEAHALRRLAMGHGADIAARAGGFGASAEQAAADYSQLFADGLANSRMVFEYLKALAELGRTAELGRWIDAGHLLGIRYFDTCDAASVQQLILDLESDAEHQDAAQSVRKMRMFKHFSDLDHPSARALMAAIELEVGKYFDTWRRSGHPLATYVPNAFRIEAWALISRGEGFNTPHIHQQGWATGIYYPAAPSAAGGTLQIGRPRDAAGSDADWDAIEIQPESGMLVLIPSFYTHWTVPLEAPGLRTSVPFDVLPAD